MSVQRVTKGTTMAKTDDDDDSKCTTSDRETEDDEDNEEEDNPIIIDDEDELKEWWQDVPAAVIKFLKKEKDEDAEAKRNHYYTPDDYDEAEVVKKEDQTEYSQKELKKLEKARSTRIQREFTEAHQTIQEELKKEIKKKKKKKCVVQSSIQNAPCLQLSAEEMAASRKAAATAYSIAKALAAKDLNRLGLLKAQRSLVVCQSMLNEVRKDEEDYKSIEGWDDDWTEGIGCMRVMHVLFDRDGTPARYFSNELAIGHHIRMPDKPITVSQWATTLTPGVRARFMAMEKIDDSLDLNITDTFESACCEAEKKGAIAISDGKTKKKAKRKRDNNDIDDKNDNAAAGAATPGTGHHHPKCNTEHTSLNAPLKAYLKPYEPIAKWVRTTFRDESHTEYASGVRSKFLMSLCRDKVEDCKDVILGRILHTVFCSSRRGGRGQGTSYLGVRLSDDLQKRYKEWLEQQKIKPTKPASASKKKSSTSGNSNKKSRTE